MRISRYLALSALVAVLVLLSLLVPPQLSAWNDRTLLDVPQVRREEDMGGLAESISLTVPEKLLLMRTGDLTTMEITSPGAEELPAVLWQEQEAGGAHAASAAGEAAEALEDLEAQWQSRLQEALEEVRILQHLGGLPAMWSQEETVELTERRQTLYIDQNTQIGFLVNAMTLSCPPYTLYLTVDDETGKLLAATLRWGKGAAPAWGAAGAANFGGAWRDYWGMDSVGAAWGGYLTDLLEGAALLQNSGEYTSSAEVSFTYNEETLRVLLLCRSVGGREYTVQWNYG